MKLYSCRFAPMGENPLHAVHNAQRVVHRGQTVHEVFAPDAFAGTRSADVPILLDHDVTRRAGTVRAKAAVGDWHLADFVLDGPYAAQAAEWIAASGRVSPGFHDHEKDPISAREPAPMNWYLRCTLDEISIVPPGTIAWYVGAKVTRISELPQPSPAAVARSPVVEPAAGEVVVEAQLIRRENIGQVLRVR